MKRSGRMGIAQSTVEIIERETYQAPKGQTVDISELIEACLTRTEYFSPEQLKRVCQEVLVQTAPGFATQFEVANETTLQGIARLQQSGPVAALNFASAKNPGGGFLNGSQAQEESLARSSALYASLQKAWVFYEQHRANSSLLYSDAMILSPDCPIIRDDEGSLLDPPHFATFITSAAPNAGAAANNRPEELAEIPETFQRRSACVLALAASKGYRNLVLGAWGCGVFRNDPQLVAKTFADHLRHGMWAGRFERVVFSVLDLSHSLETLRAFQEPFSA